MQWLKTEVKNRELIPAALALVACATGYGLLIGVVPKIGPAAVYGVATVFVVGAMWEIVLETILALGWTWMDKKLFVVLGTVSNVAVHLILTPPLNTLPWIISFEVILAIVRVKTVFAVPEEEQFEWASWLLTLSVIRGSCFASAYIVAIIAN